MFYDQDLGSPQRTDARRLGGAAMRWSAYDTSFMAGICKVPRRQWRILQLSLRTPNRGA
jgi:hypothetical protein